MPGTDSDVPSLPGPEGLPSSSIPLNSRLNPAYQERGIGSESWDVVWAPSVQPWIPKVAVSLLPYITPDHSLVQDFHSTQR